MDPKILLLIPGLIYGVGMVQLLKVFQEGTYWESRILAFLLFLSLIVNWFVYAEALSESVNLVFYTLTMISPLLFTRACMVLMGSDQSDNSSKKHFFTIRRSFFFLLTAHTLVNVILQEFIYQGDYQIFRFIGVLMLLACALFNYIWLRVAMMTIFLAIYAYTFSTVQIVP